jgi:energy-coupling factor transporter ATP-binding protein EcfA2
MSSTIEFADFSYTYPQAPHPTLRNLSLELPEGVLTLVVGDSGVGKSTLLRALNGLVPHFSGGTVSGYLSVFGVEPYRTAPQLMGQWVGFVFQDPESQSVMEQVEEEIAFGLQQQGVDAATIRLRVEEVLDLLGIAPLRQRSLHTLSGGERQRVAIASALAMRPRLLVLDEPTSQLDPLAADEVFQALMRLNQDLGLTVVVAEHRIERILPYADAVLSLHANGVEVGTPREILPHLVNVPPVVEVGRRLGWNPLPLSIKEGRPFTRRLTLPPMSPLPAPVRSGTPLIEAKGVTVQYGSHTALHQAALTLYAGDLMVMMGRNGSGKSTFMRSLVGLVRPQSGRIRVGTYDVRQTDTATLCRTVGYLPQNPDDLLYADTVREEWQFALKQQGLDPEKGWAERAVPLLETLGLTPLLERYPRDLSVGERQRVALGVIMLARPQILLLDEPTRGLDAGTKQSLAALLQTWAREGMGIVIVTHDVEFAAQVATWVMVMGEGEVAAEGTPAAVMVPSPLFAPQMARLFPQQQWLTPEAALDVLGNT